MSGERSAEEAATWRVLEQKSRQSLAGADGWERGLPDRVTRVLMTLGGDREPPASADVAVRVTWMIRFEELRVAIAENALNPLAVLLAVGIAASVAWSSWEQGPLAARLGQVGLVLGCAALVMITLCVSTAIGVNQAAALKAGDRRRAQRRGFLRAGLVLTAAGLVAVAVLLGFESPRGVLLTLGVGAALIALGLEAWSAIMAGFARVPVWLEWAGWGALTGISVWGLLSTLAVDMPAYERGVYSVIVAIAMAVVVPLSDHLFARSGTGDAVAYLAWDDLRQSGLPSLGGRRIYNKVRRELMVARQGERLVLLRRSPADEGLHGMVRLAAAAVTLLVLAWPLLRLVGLVALGPGGVSVRGVMRAIGSVVGGDLGLTLADGLWGPVLFVGVLAGVAVLLRLIYQLLVRGAGHMPVWPWHELGDWGSLESFEIGRQDDYYFGGGAERKPKSGSVMIANFAGGGTALIAEHEGGAVGMRRLHTQLMDVFITGRDAHFRREAVATATVAAGMPAERPSEL